MTKRRFYIYLAIICGYVFCILAFLLLKDSFLEWILPFGLAVCCEQNATRLLKEEKRVIKNTQTKTSYKTNKKVKARKPYTNSRKKVRRHS